MPRISDWLSPIALGDCTLVNYMTGAGGGQVARGLNQIYVESPCILAGVYYSRVAENHRGLEKSGELMVYE